MRVALAAETPENRDLSFFALVRVIAEIARFEISMRRMIFIRKGEMPKFLRSRLDLRKACLPCCDFGFSSFRTFVIPSSNGLLRVRGSVERNKKGERGSHLRSANRERSRPAGGIYRRQVGNLSHDRVQSYQIACLKSSNIFEKSQFWVRSRCGVRTCVKKIFREKGQKVRSEKEAFWGTPNFGGIQERGKGRFRHRF